MGKVPLESYQPVKIDWSFLVSVIEPTLVKLVQLTSPMTHPEAALTFLQQRFCSILSYTVEQNSIQHSRRTPPKGTCFFAGSTLRIFRGPVFNRFPILR